jgi:putative transposase
VRQFISIRYGERLAEIGATPSIGSIGDNGYYQAELIYGPARTGHGRRSKRRAGHPELGLLAQHQPPTHYLGDIPFTELEAAFYDAQRTDQPLIGIQ